MIKSMLICTDRVDFDVADRAAKLGTVTGIPADKRLVSAQLVTQLHYCSYYQKN